MRTIAERFDVASATRKKFEPPVLSLQDDGRWPGFRLEHWAGESSDLPESVLSQHGIAVNLEAHLTSEIYWSGHRRIKGEYCSGQSFVYPSAMPFQVSSRGFWRGLIIAIDPAYFQSVTSAGKDRMTELRPIAGASDGFIFQAARALADDIRAGYPSGPMYGEALGIAVVMHLARNYSNFDQKASNRSLQSLQMRSRIREFMLDQMHQDISLASMAAFSGMGVYAFSRWFKREFGVPPYQYLLSARIERAKSMLANTTISIVEIALKCGFYSQSHLATAFRRCVGVPPKIYRESFQR